MNAMICKILNRNLSKDEKKILSMVQYIKGNVTNNQVNSIPRNLKKRLRRKKRDR